VTVSSRDAAGCPCGTLASNVAPPLAAGQPERRHSHRRPLTAEQRALGGGYIRNGHDCAIALNGHYLNPRAPGTVPRVTDWTSTASTLFAGVGLVFAGQQVLLGNRQVREDRRLGLEGVVVSWRVVEAPAAAEKDGSAVWTYEVTVTNPGKFAIDRVAIDWVFPGPVQRLRYDGSADAPSHELRLSTPVLPGGGQCMWRRTVRMDFVESRADTYAEVSFNDILGRQRQNRWPRPVSPDRTGGA
jgi:hypothetical protein